MKRLLLTLFCLVAPTALGATPLESLRANQAAARAQVSSTRTAQLQAQGELNQLATRIEALKAQAKGKLLRGGELDEALKRSQELSATLTQSASALASQQTALEAANAALLNELSSELNRLRGEFDRQTDRAVRKGLVEKMRVVRAELEQVRAALPVAQLPALGAVRPSDNPEDLLEQADLLKDNEDKVRRELNALEKRIADARQERDLDNRVRQSLGDEMIFDESDRRMRVSRSSSGGLEARGAGSPSANNKSEDMSPPPQFAAGGAPTGTQAADSTGVTPLASGTDFNSRAANESNSRDPSAGSRGVDDGRVNNPTTTPKTVSGADSRPVPGQRIAGNDEDDDLEDLEIQRAKLKGLAEEFKARAAQLQKKAAQLR